MNTADKLLKRVIEEWDADISLTDFVDGVLNDVRTYLATPRTEQEPVIAAQCNAMHNKWPEEKKEELGKVLSEIRTEQEPTVWMMTREDIDGAAFEFGRREVEKYWANRGYTIEPLYSKPQVTQKPSAYIWTVNDWDETFEDCSCDFETPPIESLYITNVRPLFLHPAPKRKPLSNGEIRSGCCTSSDSEWLNFRAGVRFAEKHHQIGEGDE